MIYLNVFWVGGLICLIGQVIFDHTRLTMGHILTGMVVAGGILGGLGWYDKLVEYAGAGATMPIMSFGNSLVKGAIAEASSKGFIGLLTGMFELTSSGVAATLVFAFLVAIIFKPK